jgi:hypothetical protein
VANTYLGNGIAIPHGLPKDRELIVQTGISVSQFPEGVQWNQGVKRWYLVVAIAARSDEHIELLANLTDVLDDPETVQRLARTSEPADIIERLTQPRDGGAVSTDAPAGAADDFAKWVDCRDDRPGRDCTPARRPPSSTSPNSSSRKCASATSARWPTARAWSRC